MFDFVQITAQVISAFADQVCSTQKCNIFYNFVTLFYYFFKELKGVFARIEFQ